MERDGDIIRFTDKERRLAPDILCPDLPVDSVPSVSVGLSIRADELQSDAEQRISFVLGIQPGGGRVISLTALRISLLSRQIEKEYFSNPDS